MRPHSNAPGRMPRRRAGLTLIEVMLAIAILGLGLVALITTISRCLGVVRQARNFQTARHLLARAELENALQLEEQIEEGAEEGGFDGAPSEYRWSRTVERFGREEDGLFTVTWRVTWSEKGRASSEEVVTRLYAPEVKEGGSFTGPGGPR
ncbi:MAG TPA: prepilin-type N-terminal cleavage/methylation domain-containing protein [Kiritimatiellia bacterium]|nr:prepilin-type N-terminal cleavage/methylation domain-containing protein [Kiritimatiellia bacterium]HSA18873.1 prepilin-type N-terminal cleavage/methylation domain-containing protein [Kiritimatiellia bacterium]